MGEPWKTYQTNTPGPWDNYSEKQLTVSTLMSGEEPQEESWTATLPSLLGGIAGGFAKTIAGRAGASGVLAGGGEAYHQL